MGDKSIDQINAKPNEKLVVALLPAYTITNIQNKVRILDGTKVTYSSWVKLFTSHAWRTLSDELLVRVLKTESTAREARVRISKLSTPSLEAYCQRLRELADMLDVFESPVPESLLILQLVRGLPPEYDTTASLISQNLPSWEDATGMLQLEHQR
ncbi:uncharacterized protein LOC110902214 [Helianthus annuus]|uniref:uncharacterized protein LOC110902214 n=1 Tax=Helianthus annuus TaxID=4232 RepID=UPI000B8FDF48|nr:uncharacterized protein LOC110902214 [Helianthus annuus]